MKELTRDVAQYLIDNGVGTAIGDDIMLDYTPDTPDNIIFVSEYNGPPTTQGVEAVDRRLQIKVRNESYSVARERAWAAFVLLDKPEEENIIQFTTERWGVSWGKQTPALLERDSTGRSVFVFNIGVATYRDA